MLVWTPPLAPDKLLTEKYWVTGSAIPQGFARTPNSQGAEMLEIPLFYLSGGCLTEKY